MTWTAPSPYNDGMQPLLYLDDIHPPWPPGGPPPFSGLSLRLKPGERIAVLGPEGSGKTLLWRLMAGLDAPVRGRILMEGREMTDLTPIQRADRIGALGENPGGQFLTARVGEEIDLGLQRLPVPARQARIAAALENAGLDQSILERAPESLSASQRERAMLAAVLAMEPRILLWDEPAARLSPIGENAVAERLAVLAAEKGMALAAFTSRPDRARRFGERLFKLEKGGLRPAASGMLRGS